MLSRINNVLQGVDLGSEKRPKDVLPLIDSFFENEEERMVKIPTFRAGKESINELRVVDHSLFFILSPSSRGAETLFGKNVDKKKIFTLLKTYVLLKNVSLNLKSFALEDLLNDYPIDGELSDIESFLSKEVRPYSKNFQLILGCMKKYFSGKSDQEASFFLLGVDESISEKFPEISKKVDEIKGKEKYAPLFDGLLGRDLSKNDRECLLDELEKELTEKCGLLYQILNLSFSEVPPRFAYDSRKIIKKSEDFGMSEVQVKKALLERYISYVLSFYDPGKNYKDVSFGEYMREIGEQTAGFLGESESSEFLRELHAFQQI